MATFSEANQVRLALKMLYSNSAWYKSSVVNSEDDGFGVLIRTTYINNTIRKLIVPWVNGVLVRVEVD